MSDELFPHFPPRSRHRNGPLAEDRHRYLVHLAHQGFSRETLRRIACYLLVIAYSLRLDKRSGELISEGEIKVHAARWAHRHPKPPTQKDPRHARAHFRWHATQWLQFLGRLQTALAAPHPFAKEIAAFTDYMRFEKGLSPQTIRTHGWTVQQFLGRLGRTGLGLTDLSPVQIDQILADQVLQGGCARVTVQNYATALRAFFRYATEQGWCRSKLADAIRGPRLYAHETLPSGPSWEQVQQLLAGTVGNQPKDLRDRAILMLLAVYGLRAGEVIRLCLDDFDWERELLVLTHSKPGRSRAFPLTRAVGDAILRYLKEVRPRCDHRELFLTLRAPFRPLHSSSLWPVVGERLRALGVSLPHLGSHALRHACATHLLAQGLSLKEIGDHLGHQHTDTTRIYAKVDLAALREVADFDLGGFR
jgi:integrase/recombinase XerD